MFEMHAVIGGAELPINALLGRVTGLRPRGDLHMDRGLARQDAQFWFGPVGASCRIGA